MTANTYGASFWDDENVLELVVLVAQLCEWNVLHTIESHTLKK